MPHIGQSVGVQLESEHNQRARRVQSDDRLYNGRWLWQVRRSRRQWTRQRFPLRIGCRRRYNYILLLIVIKLSTDVVVFSTYKSYDRLIGRVRRGTDIIIFNTELLYPLDFRYIFTRHDAIEPFYFHREDENALQRAIKPRCNLICVIKNWKLWLKNNTYFKNYNLLRLRQNNIICENSVFSNFS